MSLSNGAVVTPEDFRKERERRDNKELDKIKDKLNKKWAGYVRGFDTDYDPVPAKNQNE